MKTQTARAQLRLVIYAGAAIALCAAVTVARVHAQAPGPSAAAPLAFLVFLAFLWWQFGTPLAFFRAQNELGYGTVRHPIGL